MTTLKRSLITIALMIKNEANAIEATLTSLAAGGIQNFFVLDTGSSDNTVQLTQAFFDKRPNLVGHIIQEEFIDFASSRNRTLELAEQYFQDTEFFLMPDAEWHLYHHEALINFCNQERLSRTPLYLVTIKMNSTTFSAARLFRASVRIRFKGVVHEAPEQIAHVKTPDPIYFEVKASHQGIEKSQLRWQRDLLLLINACEKNPEDPRTVFYLAQTYECLGLLEKAYEYYEYRSTLTGWDEENFITLFRLGYLAERIKPWAIAMEYYLRAFSMRSHRIEPLVKIAEHYWPSNIHTAFLFIRQACDTPYPTTDLLFIEEEIYNYTRYEIMSRCAWYMGQYKLGEEATLSSLAVHPEMPHLQANLKLYREKLDL